MYSLFFYLLEEFEKVDISSSVNSWYYSPGLISLLVIGLFIFSVSSRFSHCRFYFSRNLSISFWLSNMLLYNYFIIIAYYPFYLCGISCNVSCFVYNFISPCFLVSAATVFSMLFMFSNNQLSISLIFSSVFLCFTSFISLQSLLFPASSCYFGNRLLFFLSSLKCKVMMLTSFLSFYLM